MHRTGLGPDRAGVALLSSGGGGLNGGKGQDRQEFSRPGGVLGRPSL